MLQKINPQKIGWTGYVYLVYLVFLFIQPIFDPNFGTQQWLFTIGLILIFLPAYFIAFLASGKIRIIAICIIAILGFIGTTAITGMYNSGASCFFIYAAAAAATVFRPRKAVLFIAFIIALNVLGYFLFVAPYTTEGKFYIFAPGIFFTLLVGFVCIFDAEKERNSNKLDLAHKEIEHLATIAERERIARDLHDLLGHTLTVITLKSELATKLIDKDLAATKQEIQDIETISRKTLGEVRHAVSGYKQKGLMAEVASAKLALEPANVDFIFKGDVNILSPQQESTLSLVLREAVTNIIRHAKASTCSVELKENGDTIELEIADNGIGMNAKMGHGLTGIRDRVAMLGGDFNIRNFQGTTLRINFTKDPTLSSVKAPTSSTQKFNTQIPLDAT